MSNIFRFKQFSVDQSGCAMKINTDGVLLGAMAYSESPKNVLDIGAGTGVIALMLAQRFGNAKIDAVEIDQNAAETASSNFLNSPFAERLLCYHVSFEQYFSQFPDHKYDLIVSNPPFFLNSLKNPDHKKEIARHTDSGFFESFLSLSSQHLNEQGNLWIILPVNIVDLILNIAAKAQLFIHHHIAIRSFKEDEPHRAILCFNKHEGKVSIKDFIIYKEYKVYSAHYRDVLKPFFTIF